ncbi:RNA polymerase II transcription mediator family protein [Blastomyces dermatitidis ATCC 18188]|uniref:Mediator of RNA polymerase II transcription subunit 21 n=1 Tax=Ajellomyces dermatitidis (strain ATCC 18188 / CBS 674.68) TaxID=653446 RepID=F2TL83_AJEDA|nr:RNA polymerase II transcription mediator family protein [Blastomyces dermatitidis ATCC 18188]
MTNSARNGQFYAYRDKQLYMLNLSLSIFKIIAHHPQLLAREATALRSTTTSATMADILTQLQTCLDQLATQFYATLCYLTTYHDHSAATPPSNVPTAIPQLKKIPKNPPPTTTVSTTAKGTSGAAASSQAQQSTTPAAAEAQAQQEESPPAEPTPDTPEIFALRQRELARDLIVKEQQIEYLISVLPGVGSSETEQEERIRRLAEELRVVEAERMEKRREMRRLGERVDELLGAVEGRG